MSRDDWPSVLRVTSVEDPMAMVDLLGAKDSPPLDELDRLALLRISSTCRSGPDHDLIADAAARVVECFLGWGAFALAADADWTKQAVRARVPLDISSWPAELHGVDARHLTLEANGYRARAVYAPFDLGGSGAILEAAERLGLRSICLLADEFDPGVVEKWVGGFTTEPSTWRPWAHDVSLIDPHHIVMRWSGFGQPCPAFDFIGPLATMRAAVQRVMRLAMDDATVDADKEAAEGEGPSSNRGFPRGS